ncbi:kinase-like domain-containing protein [Zychaea mexicana]|uniref:kinase-like domain-containing protein n=1 Tax=Zychaea mexicana TaxID=64656 RepID=UPI0022FF34D4|nr:kinase-like domain-containing protein [Zychaea mexicana]KAI9472876.1 kinase-like domain-containing protein [Zychaea mexicana]
MGAVCCSQAGLDLDGEVDLSHFTLLRSVGKGAFGKVRVIQHKGTKKLYALKYINKAKCIQMRAVENIISERRILEQVSHGLIVNLRYAFQDDDNLFMILDLMLGGDLRFHLDRLGVMPESYVQFYAAEVALSLRHLHNNKVIHRDIKPDNILLDDQGHAHLTDFNIAVQFSGSKPLTSIAGSMAYMAPEVLAKRGYGSSVDWWSLGVVCFELMFGKRPFRAKTNDALQHAIMHEPLCFPENSHVSSDAIDFVKGLLTRDINRRLGVKDKGFSQLVSHPWLRNIQWELLESKQACPPFIPDSKRANFDPTHELEEILLEDNPLIVRKRNPKRSAASHANTSLRSQSINDLAESSPERQIMEEKFIVYDHTKPEENEWRKREMEQRRWAQKMTKTNQEHHQHQQHHSHRQSGGRNSSDSEKPQQFAAQSAHQQPPPRHSSAKVGGTYKTSVMDYVSQKPATPLSDGDLVKMEELARMARAGVGKERGTDWRPPSGILPPSSYAEPPYDEYMARAAAGSEQLDHYHRHRRRSSDESYPTSASPETSERPLVGTASSSFVSLEQIQQQPQQQQRMHQRQQQPQHQQQLQQPAPITSLPPTPSDPPFSSMTPTPPLSQSGEDDYSTTYYNRSYPSSSSQPSTNKQPSSRPMSPSSSSKPLSSVSSLSLRQQYPPTVDQIPPPLAPPTSLPPPVPSMLPPPPAAAVASPLHHRRPPPP